jgi:hypothetical protein
MLIIEITLAAELNATRIHTHIANHFKLGSFAMSHGQLRGCKVATLHQRVNDWQLTPPI